MTISSVAPAVPPTTAGSTATGPDTGGLGGLFAGILQAGAGLDAQGHPTDLASTVLPGAAVPEAEEGVDAAAVPEPLPGPDPAGVAEILAAAQVMAAAQVVPVTPVLAQALATRSGTPFAPADLVGGTSTVAPAGSAADLTTDVPAGPPTGTPTGSTAVSAGDLVLPSVPSGDVPLATPAVTEQAGTEQTVKGTAPEGGLPGPVEAAPSQDAHDARPDSGPTGRPQAEATAPASGTSGAQANAPSTAPVASPAAPVAAAVSAAGPDAAPAAQVTGQVFPEVGRLVSRGDGTRRITLKLAPEALGEVRVVLTVRDGAVEVRMAGSEQAQQALRAGAPELQRLLDLTGATSSQIIVGDQGSEPDAGQHGGPGTGRDPEDHRTAGTRDGDTSARDGFPGGPQSRPSTDPTATRGVHTRTLTGVDVTM